MSRQITTVDRGSAVPDSDLLMAIWSNNSSLVNRLLENGVSDELLNWGLIAAVHSSPEILHLLLLAGADPNFDSGKALVLSVRRKDHSRSLLLLAHGARPEWVSFPLLLNTVRHDTLGLVTTLITARDDLDREDRWFVELLIQLHSEAQYLCTTVPSELELDKRKRDLLCDAITGCLMRGEEAKIRALIFAYQRSRQALEILLECIASRDHMSKNFQKMRDLILSLISKLDGETVRK
jgi:hypothetical protein